MQEGEGFEQMHSEQDVTLCANWTEVCTEGMTMDKKTDLIIYWSLSCRAKDARQHWDVQPRRSGSQTGADHWTNADLQQQVENDNGTDSNEPTFLPPCLCQ